MLFTTLAFLPLVENHVVGLYVQHTRGDVAANSPHVIVQTFFTVIGDPHIRTIQVNRHRKGFEIPVVHAHAVRPVLERQTTHLQRIMLEDFPEIFLYVVH